MLAVVAVNGNHTLHSRRLPPLLPVPVSGWPEPAAGIILYGACRFSGTSGMLSPAFTCDKIMLRGIFGASLFALWKLRTHPFCVIVLSGLVGIALFA
ncbi:hypothetical protein [Paenibacillus sp. S150]|uniref:hypothetical protein n=1 Tax=Paenibacillus sp. S150 TaxID=2749826 RepID=UPI001C58C362|nr:hypothetical protein [Paenibacillus sp. S150]MBW4082463.1 hypothetical protein [Paenibacillus sp. S150]